MLYKALHKLKHLSLKNNNNNNNNHYDDDGDDDFKKKLWSIQTWKKVYFWNHTKEKYQEVIW